MAHIEDPSTGYKASVTKRNELKTFAVTESESEFANTKGDVYNINSGEITSLSAGDASLIYFYNDEDVDYVLSAVAVGIRGFTGLSDMATVTIIRNPTGGDLISDATAASINSNSNFGSSRTTSTGTLVYKGKAAGTISGGADHAIIYIGNNSRVFATIPIEIPKGSAIAVKIDSDATARSAYCALVGYFKDAIRENS